MGNTPSTEAQRPSAPSIPESASRAATIPAKRTKIAGSNVTLSEPSSPQGVTFLLPGSMVDENEYNSIRNVLLEKNQVVLSFYINVLAASHEKFAERASKIFDEYHSQYSNLLPPKYNVVGHSVGGKISLLLAAKIDPNRVKTVVSLDPVDEKPVQFTNSTSEFNLTLEHASANVYITWASASPSSGILGIKKQHNARAIHTANSAWIKPLIVFNDAAHFAYTDNGGGWVGLLIRGGTKEGNAAARADTLELIRQVC